MSQHARGLLARYGAASGFVVLAMLASLVLGRLNPLPAATFLVAIMTTAWVGGLGPALFATVLSTLALDYFCLPQYHSLDPGKATWVWTGVFIVAALAITLIQEKQHQLTNALRLQDERKSRFVAALAHELRNFLSPISFAIASLQVAAAADSQMEEACAIADRQVRNMSRLINDLLDVARINQGKVQLALEQIDIREVLNRSLEAAKPLIQAREHRLETSIPATRLMVQADLVRLQQVFVNLLTNAAKYTDPGGHITVLVDRVDQDCVVRVRDNGKGLAKEMQTKVFDLFMQAENGSGGGLGIGLSLVRSIVEMHGGTVAAFSEGPGLGSEFLVRLPT